MTATGSRRTAVALAALAAAIIGGQALASPESEGYYRDGLRYLEQGELRAAVIQLKNAVRADPADGELRHALAKAYLRLGDPLSAEKELQAARQRGVPEQRLGADLAQAHVMAGRYRQALDGPSVKDLPAAEEGALRLWRGYALFALGKAEEGATELRRAAELRPDDARPHIGLARMLAQGGDLAAAGAAAEKAVALAGAAEERAEALGIAGELLRRSGDDEAALARFAEAIAADPNAAIARLGRAALMVDRDRLDEAEDDLRRVREASPGSAIAAHLLAIVAVKREQPAVALELLSSPVVANHPPSQFLLASLHFDRRELQQADAALARYVRLAGRDLRSQLLLGRVLLAQRAPQRAVAVLTEAAEAAPDDPRLLALLAAAHAQAGDGAAAGRALDRAAAAAPDDPRLRTRLALQRLWIGEPGDAASDLAALRDSGPPSTETLILIALANLKAGDHEAAMAAVRELETALPDSPVPAQIAGGVHLQRGDAAAARRSFEAALARDPGFSAARLQLAALDRAEGRPAEAERAYRRVLESEADNLAALLALADLRLAAGRAEEAVALIERARVTHPKASAPRLRLIDLHLRRGEAQKAVAEAHALAREAPEEAAAAEALGRAQWAAGERASALASFRRAAVLAPESAAMQLRLAKALRVAGQLDAAAAAAASATRLDDALIAAWAERVEIAVAAGRRDDALRLAEEWRERHPEMAAGDLLVGDVLMHLGRAGEAAEAYAAALAKQPSTGAAVRHAQASFIAGRREEALASLEQRLTEHPDETPARRALAGLYLQAGAEDQALGQYERLLATGGEDPVVLNNLAWLYGRRGDQRAIPYAERAHAIAPQAPTIADTLGILLVRAGQVERGLRLLREAQAAAPGMPAIRTHLAEALLAAGKADEGRALLDELLAEAPDSAAAGEARELLERMEE